MARSTVITAAGHSVDGLKRIIDLDVEASNELQAKIDQLRNELKSGVRNAEIEERIVVMECTNKDMTRGVVRRIERMEKQGQRQLTATDRDLLQALNSQLAVCDRQAMQLAELRHLEEEPPAPPPIVKRPTREKVNKTEEHLPLGGTPRKPSTSPGPQATDHLRPRGDPRSTSPGPILFEQKVDSKTGSPAAALPPIAKSTSPGGRRSTTAVADSPFRRPSLSPYAVKPNSSVPNRIGEQKPLPFVTDPLAPNGAAEKQYPPAPAEKVPYDFWYKRDSMDVEPTRRPSMLGDRLESAPRPPQRSPTFPLVDAESPRGSTDSRRPGSRGNVLNRTLSNSPQTSPTVCGRVPHMSKDRGSSRGSTDTPRSSLGSMSYDYCDDDANLDTGVSFGPEKSSWPLLYRILDVDPVTPSVLFEQMASRAVARLSVKHDPAKCPNDPEAPVRWAAVTKAYDTLLDPERRRLYDLHHQERKDFDDFDLAMLSVSEKN